MPKNQSLIEEIPESSTQHQLIEDRSIDDNQISWQKLLANAIRDPAELLSLLKLDPRQLNKKHFNPQHFPLRVPHSFVKKMRIGDWNDPLLKQILPLEAEANLTDGFQLDPVSDLKAISQKGILQKYSGRALIMTTGACAIHCRYCFRQHFPYSAQQASKNEWRDIIKALAADDSIHEVILSGGDPLTLSDRRLQSLCKQIADIPHITTLRFHTRLPLVLPERIDAHFMQWFSSLTLQKVMVIHANHANEFCENTRTALMQLHQSGTLLLNQSVLLKGINDTAEDLIALSNTLLAHQVLPYYLHLLDRVQGAAHFEVDATQALLLMQKLRNALPGYLVPKLVRETSGERSKTPIN
ncbi:MAG: EF-P beta-lysylation protein EpmB [Thiotrichaceae bacterium]